MPTDFNITTRGNFALLGRQIQVQAFAIPSLTKQATREISNEFLRVAKAKAPVRDTGNLKGAIYRTPAEAIGPGRFISEIGVDLHRAPYAVFVEYGTGVYGREHKPITSSAIPEPETGAKRLFEQGRKPRQNTTGSRYKKLFPSLYTDSDTPSGNFRTEFGRRVGRSAGAEMPRVGHGNLVFFSSYTGAGRSLSGWYRPKFVKGQKGQHFMEESWNEVRRLFLPRIEAALLKRMMNI